MSTVTPIASVQNRTATIADIAAKTGFSKGTVYDCLSAKYSAKYSEKTVDTIRKAAVELGYIKHKGRKTPANSVFASRAAETAAMTQLRNSGHSNHEIAHRCGVDVMTVYSRIGKQPEEITAANLKLAGKVRSAKVKIKNAYANQKLVASYNAKMEALNAEMAKVKKLAEEVEAMKKSAAKASKATGTPLLRLVS